MKLASLPIAAAALCASILPNAANAQDMIGVTFFGQLVVVDSETGATVADGITIGSHNSMARDDAGNLWSLAIAGQSPVGIFLTRIDPVSLTATPVHQLPIHTDLRALSRGPNNSLYGIQQNGPSLQTLDELVQIDLQTGQITTIGSTDLIGIQAMATLGDTVYAWDAFLGLVTIDTATGLATDVAPGPSAGGFLEDFQWLSATPDGRLLGGRSQIFELDLVTGSATPIGTPSSIDLRGAEFPSLAYPYGSGCGVNEPIELSVSGSIRPGGLLTTNSENHRISLIPEPTLGFLLIGLSNESAAGVPLPLVLGPLLGATGCELGVRPDITLSSVVNPATGVLAVVLPLPSALAVDRFYLQHVGFDMQAPGASVWSNSVGVVVQ